MKKPAAAGFFFGLSPARRLERSFLNYNPAGSKIFRKGQQT